MVTALAVGPGDTVEVDQPLLWLTEGDIAHAAEDVADEVDLDRIRPDLADVLARQAKTLDAGPARGHRQAPRRIGHRSARENVDDLCDPGTFVEYGSLMVAAQRRRRTRRGPHRPHAGRRHGGRRSATSTATASSPTGPGAS